MRRILTVSLLAVLTITVVRGQDNARDFEIAKSMEIFMNVFRDVNLFYVDSTDPGKMLKDAAEGMLENLDPYTEYIPESDKENLDIITTGAYGGIGALIRRSGEWVEISEPYYGSPADKAGLRAGDRILEIDSQSAHMQEVGQISGRLKGVPGTTVTLLIRPVEDTATNRKVEIKREKIVLPSVPYYGMLDNSTGYIKLDNFTDESSREVRSALEKLRSGNNLSGLVLDLRNNGGGLMSEAVKIVGMFVPRGTPVVETRGKIKEYDSYYKTTGSPIDTKLPLAVLINSASASASEIVAGALQDLDRAVIIGQRSFGKGLVQVPRPVGYNSFLKLTTAKYYIPSGRCIQAVDYTHRREDGSVGRVPDSLITEYHTTHGRKVYDGGGVNPDVKIESQYMVKFAAILSALGFIDDFANRYAVENEPVAEGFTVDDATYGRFGEYVESKNFDVETGTSHALRELRKVAEREKYDERIAAEIEAIADKIRDDKTADLKQFAPELKEMIAGAVVNRWYYYPGRIKYMIATDPLAAEAVKVLSDPALYDEITTARDTQKN